MSDSQDVIDSYIPMDKIAEGQQLPFNERKQDALLGHLVMNEPFFLQARGRIRAEWFLDPWATKVWAATLVFFDRFKRKPNEHELSQSDEFIRQDPAAQSRMRAKLNVCKIAALEFGLDAIRSELTVWLKSRIFLSYIGKANETYNAASNGPRADLKFAEAFATWKRGAMEVEQTSFDLDTDVGFDDVPGGEFFHMRNLELSNALTFGCDMVDRKLNPSCSSGSLLRGDHTVLLAPTNVGKTTTMINVIVENMYRHKSVLLVTHEGSADDIKTKIMQAYTRQTQSQLVELSSTAEGQQLLKMLAERLRTGLTFVPIHKPGLNVEDVEASIRRYQERRIATTGSGYDLIVDDYPAKLWTSAAGKGWARRQADEHIYNYFTQMGLEFKAHVLTAIQTNREGSKINQHRKGAEERLLGLEDVAESFPVMATATNVISLNRDPAAMARNRMTFHVCKSRSSDTGWSIVTKTDFVRARTHGNHLDATVYRGLSPMTDTIDELLVRHANQAIPEGYSYHA